jgi:hypothetical protein
MADFTVHRRHAELRHFVIAQNFYYSPDRKFTGSDEPPENGDRIKGEIVYNSRGGA